MCVYMYVCVYVYIHICIRICVYTYMYTYIHLNYRRIVSFPLCMCMCVCVYTYMYMYVCICIYIYVYVYTFKLQTKCFVSTTINSTKCLANWIPLKIQARVRMNQRHLKASFCLMVILKIAFATCASVQNGGDGEGNVGGIP